MDGWMISYYRKSPLMGRLCEFNHTLISNASQSELSPTDPSLIRLTLQMLGVSVTSAGIYRTPQRLALLPQPLVPALLSSFPVLLVYTKTLILQ